ncbi:hypothetical protein ABZZ74_49645 [Streptomyces sp. NPDC006476]|uniref:hypothetical protein n=1 Tax=Streptomyces sp. NPDC006476 TaxID=3157175 RepID=UPI00339EE697
MFEQQRDVGGGEVGAKNACPVRTAHQVVEGGPEPVGRLHDLVGGRQPTAHERQFDTSFASENREQRRSGTATGMASSCAGALEAAC